MRGGPKSLRLLIVVVGRRRGDEIQMVVQQWKIEERYWCAKELRLC